MEALVAVCILLAAAAVVALPLAGVFRGRAQGPRFSGGATDDSIVAQAHRADAKRKYRVNINAPARVEMGRSFHIEVRIGQSARRDGPAGVLRLAPGGTVEILVQSQAFDVLPLPPIRLLDRRNPPLYLMARSRDGARRGPNACQLVVKRTTPDETLLSLPFTIDLVQHARWQDRLLARLPVASQGVVAALATIALLAQSTTSALAAIATIPPVLLLYWNGIVTYAQSGKVKGSFNA